MNLDIKLSPEGDLVLGQQQTDEDGYLLYYMDGHGENNKPQLTIDPEVGTIPVRDIELVHAEDSELQLIKSRVQTEAPDWILYPDLGGNLTDLIGLPNNQATADKGKALLRNTLTYDEAFDGEDLRIEAIPVSRNELLFDIHLMRNERLIRYALTFDFRVGVVNEYEVVKEVN